MLSARITVGLLTLLAGAAASAQTVTAPSAEMQAPGFPAVVLDDPYVQPTQATSATNGHLLGPTSGQASESMLPPGTRAGFFQKLNVWSEWMPRLEDDSVGVTGLGADVVFGVPLLSRETPLIITPGYHVNFLSGPDFVDLPSRVHDAQIDFHHFRKLSDNWLFDGAVTLGVYADDYNFDNSDAFRVTGRALGVRDFHNNWKGVVGVVYLNRAGYSVVPAAGLMYDCGDLKLDLVFPRPRLAVRTYNACPGCDERWVYLQGEFGGNRWAVRRDSGLDDTLAYRDLRVLIGTERKLVGGVSRRWELGYVFSREIEYEDSAFEASLDDSLFVRGGLSY
ncbi:hypothetical protein Pla123a_41570 [Posidoniimonas polymericola]|uniref:DUF6268 domain-containing protein n=1 Tax=Posidoniimonas polymericola TaxID=2528002 RepID=A0A5C5XYI4_9BACT|nr:DUF6268 family outer membrane beta-barrel protein [Posidoniimonas polymericola]TWT67601.1 hypothetical protein Pla123a_41570 [Posidoniimonas polymericola]